MEDRERTVWVFVHLNGHLDKMPAMALLRDLQHPSLVAHGVVIADDALMANAQDLVQRAKERHEGAPLFGRGDRKAAVVLWDVDLPQILVGRRDRRDAVQPQQRRQPLLQGAEHPLHATACFRAVGRDVLDLQLRQGAADLGQVHPVDLAAGLGPGIAKTKPVLGLQRLVEVLHRKVPIACPVLLDDKLDLVHRRLPPGNPTAATIDQTFRAVRLVAVAKTPEVSLADPQQLCRLLATQSPRSITLQPFDIPRHPYLGSHPDPPVWKPSKNRTDRLLPNPDISSATDTASAICCSCMNFLLPLEGSAVEFSRLCRISREGASMEIRMKTFLPAVALVGALSFSSTSTLSLSGAVP